jgi:hypothetical protein
VLLPAEQLEHRRSLSNSVVEQLELSFRAGLIVRSHLVAE